MLSMLGNLNNVVLAWGDNINGKLGVMKTKQINPSPILLMEGKSVVKVATSCFHTMLLTADGTVYTMGANVCGNLGLKVTDNSVSIQAPTLVETLAAKIVDIACGARHSVAVGEKGQVFTWGSAQYGQLGLGFPKDNDGIHTSKWDMHTGSTYYFQPTPHVVQYLFHRKKTASKVACGMFFTICLTGDEASGVGVDSKLKGKCYAWGDNSNLQVVQENSEASVDVAVDPLLPQNTTVPCHFDPIIVNLENPITKIAAGGSMVLAIDTDGKVLSWGAGRWPHYVQKLQSFFCHDIDVGDSGQCIALTSLYAIEIQVANKTEFTVMGLPLDQYRGKNLIKNAPLIQVGLPFNMHKRHRVYPINKEMEVSQSIVLTDAYMKLGEWLKLTSTDFDFAVKMGDFPWIDLAGDIMMFGSVWKAEDMKNYICIIEAPANVDYELQGIGPIFSHIWECARMGMRSKAIAILLILPEEIPEFSFESQETPKDIEIPFGVILGAYGFTLRKHLDSVIAQRIQAYPEALDDWNVVEGVGGRDLFIHEKTGNLFSVPPIIKLEVVGKLLNIKRNDINERIESLIGSGHGQISPLGVLLALPSCNPDPEIVCIDRCPDEGPVALLPYEAGDELKSTLAKVSTEEDEPDENTSAFNNIRVTMRNIPGGIFTWNTSQEPRYEASLHEHQVISVACGNEKISVVSASGDCFMWNKNEKSPVLVESIEGLAKATTVFAGADQNFVLADLPYRSILL